MPKQWLYISVSVECTNTDDSDESIVTSLVFVQCASVEICGNMHVKWIHKEYWKAENGIEIETGNGNWKQKWKQTMHQSLVQCFLHRLMSSVFSLSSQQTPLHTAAKVGNEYTMREFVDLGANMNIKDNDGVSETVLLEIYWFEFEHPISKEALFVNKQRIKQV